MGNGFIIVDENEWKCASSDSRDMMMFATLRSIDDRLKKLEQRPIVDKCFAFLGGAIGGFAASLGIEVGS